MLSSINIYAAHGKFVHNHVAAFSSPVGQTEKQQQTKNFCLVINIIKVEEKKVPRKMEGGGGGGWEIFLLATIK